MPLNRTRVKEALRAFEFDRLFAEELGWDRHRMQPLSVLIDGRTYWLSALAEKRGMVAFLCEDADGALPGSATRRKIELQVRRAAHEHIIIFVDAGRTMQTWQWVRREPGKPAACREHAFHVGQPGDALIQKLEAISFSLNEEEALTITTVAGRARQAFDVDRVTKRFYDRFKTEHASFLEFIKGIQSQGDREWYASLMLNRLMFVYFIQKKGFLDRDDNYLRTRLIAMQKERGRDRFLSFYRYFLIRLFHEGLGQTASIRAVGLEELIGSVPYLNGGLFDVHRLERDYPDIEIPDAAFEKLFDFFDTYQWHLDERPLRADNEINPDVLGYIFEKYINQKQMGAYYTKEDITEYIAKSAIIPLLFTEAEKECPVAFRPDATIWRLLREDPDRYIYAEASHGCDLALPKNVLEGRAAIGKRQLWNRPADEAFALPSETWREHIARRDRYMVVRKQLVDGEVLGIHDLITKHLDMRQFAQDAIENCEGPEQLRAFYNGIENVTILDPACGSGAFLFAALNILEPLYEACIERMRSFLDDWEAAKDKGRVEKFRDFRLTLDSIDKHPNLRYFILKSIVINNLFGVDIMEEAVEICKLRLFLKLVAQVDQVADLEPLPDIDFNIRAGNSLVGFATHDEVAEAIAGTFDFDGALLRINESAEVSDRAFRRFRDLQTTVAGNSYEISAAKEELRKTLEALNLELDRHLASQYGIDASKAESLATWRATVQPFHWFVEFYGTVQGGGFDIVLGNPPYVAYSKVSGQYKIRNYTTESCGNLYAFFMERSLRLMRRDGMFGMIVPVSSVSAETFRPLITLFLDKQIWLSSYSNRPAKLFAGVEQRLTIFVVRNDSSGGVHSSPYQHWYEQERQRLFKTLSYWKASTWEHTGMPLKTGSPEAEAILQKLMSSTGQPLLLFSKRGAHGTWFHDGPTYWVRALPFEPNANTNSERSSHYHRVQVQSPAEARQLAAILSSSTFYLYFKAVSNCRDLGQKEWAMFPLGKPSDAALRTLGELGGRLEQRLRDTAGRRSRRYPSGTIEYDEYYPSKAKDIIDEIDVVLADHYKITPGELDFIRNYDFKYRMGADAQEEEGLASAQEPIRRAVAAEEPAEYGARRRRKS